MKKWLPADLSAELNHDLDHAVSKVIREFLIKHGALRFRGCIDHEVGFAVGRIAARFGLELVPSDIDALTTRAEHALARQAARSMNLEVKLIPEPEPEAPPPVTPTLELNYSVHAWGPPNDEACALRLARCFFSGADAETPQGAKMASEIRETLRVATAVKKAFIDCDSIASKFGITIRRVERTADANLIFHLG